jgi:2-dehydropantoate 2-reductase
VAPMRIAVLGGGGAMGGLLGGYLARSGLDVILVDVRPDTVAAINDDGLTIMEADGSQSLVRVQATSDPASVGPVDLVMSVVKSYHTEGAIRSAAPLLGPDTAILSLQNGWGNADRIGSIAGRQRVLVGLTYHSATLVGPGQVKHTGSGMTHIGELDGSATARLAAVAAGFSNAGLEVATSATIVNEIWKKLALNVCTLPTSALLRFQAHELNRHDGSRALMRGLLAEVSAVARAEGIELDETERWDAITSLLDRAIGGRSSMLQDVEANRQTEIDVINGAITAAGRRGGIPTPLNDSMVWLISALQEQYLANGG